MQKRTTIWGAWMRQVWGWGGERAALIAVATLVLGCSAAPVLADNTELPDAPPGPVMESSEFPVPDFTAINDAYLADVRQAEERESELQEPAFVSEREQSRYAYADASREEAEELLRMTFDRTWSSLSAEPARILSDATLEENLGNGSAVISTDGRKEILEAGLPIEAQNDAGELEKVDVGLEQNAER